MLNVFRKKPIRIEVIRKEESKLRLVDWQNDPALVSLGSKVLMDPNVKLMLSVLRNEHPSRFPLPDQTGIEARAMIQAMSQGYELALQNIEAMGISRVPILMPESVFEPAV